MLSNVKILCIFVFYLTTVVYPVMLCNELNQLMIGIIGSGSWATAIVKILLEDPTREVDWWVRRDDVREALARDHRNPHHIPSTVLDMDRVRLTGDLATLVCECSHLVLAIPSAHIASVLSQLPKEAYAGKCFISAIKGAVPETSSMVSMYLEQELGVPVANICVISGPTHAEEVSLERPTFLAVASLNANLASNVERMLSCSYLHTVRTDDVLGVELAGLMKNIYAIGAGLCQGVGYGDNMTAVYVTAAYGELQIVAHNVAPNQHHDMALYCYLGDLMVTCWSEHSRNRRLGYLLGQGMPVEEAFKQIGIVPEGYYSARIVHQYTDALLQRLPLAEAVYRVLYEGSTAQNEMERVVKSYL